MGVEGVRVEFSHKEAPSEKGGILIHSLPATYITIVNQNLPSYIYFSRSYTFHSD